ncbi:hypothetical protein [Xanthomonas arboricola]|uniref:hypothetical protein n=1 Tax=Xanthomonas arboricola TaxID=56448 RepID=UPI004040BA06
MPCLVTLRRSKERRPDGSPATVCSAGDILAIGTHDIRSRRCRHCRCVRACSRHRSARLLNQEGSPVNTINDSHDLHRPINDEHANVHACAHAGAADAKPYDDALSHWRQARLDTRVIWRRQLTLQDGISVLLAAWQMPHSMRWEWEAIDLRQDRHLCGGNCDSSLAAMRAADAWPALCGDEVAVLA